MVHEELLQKIVYLLSIASLFLFSQYAYGLDVNLIPDMDPFGPNDWITILIEIDGYQGGSVDWTAHKPDGTTDSGTLSSFVAGTKTHSIIRNAFDNQFGDWSIDYQYQDITETVSVTVEQLALELTTDKSAYQSGDTAVIILTTNYFEPVAANAESYHIEIHDKNDILVQHMDYVIIKAYQNSTNYEFSINDLLSNNPYGEYKAVVQYYNIFAEIPFTVIDPDAYATIFVGTDKSVYDPGDLVEVQLIISDLIATNAILTVTDPAGKNTVRSFPIDSTLTRVILDDVSTTIPGTYTIDVEYGGSVQTKTFAVEFETSVSVSPVIDLTVSLNQKYYRPGEALTATITTNELIADTVNYWLEDPSGAQGIKISIPMMSGNLIIPYSVPKEAVQGPWKMYVDYGGAVRFAIFFVEGEPVDQTIITSTQTNQGPELLMTIDAADLNNPKGIAIDANRDIYVVDSGNIEIKKFDASGRLLDSWGSFGSGELQFKNPSGIFVDSKFVHVADTGNSRIQTFDKNGNFVRFWGNSGIESQSLKNPISISKDSLGIFYVADTSLNKISKYDSNGDYAGHIESILTSAAKFSSSDFIVFDNNDNLFILVSDDNRILQYANDNFIKSFGSTGQDDGKFQNPYAMTLDHKGNLYVADSGNFRVQIFNSEGKFVDSWGSLGNGPGKFNTISGIAADYAGNVFVVDSKNNRIQKFAPFAILDRLEIPEWVRNNAKWWNEGTIEDNDFANGIEYMIKENIIVIPQLEESGESTTQQIPDWVKNNAGWWSEGLISDEDFANGIEYLVKNGIIQV